MTFKKYAFFFLPPLAVFMLSTPLYAEDVNLSTYYPSPYGSYKKLQIEEPSDSLGIFTGGVTKAGIQIVTDLATDDFMPGVFWTTTDDNPTIPKAGIWLHEDGSGTELYFGTSSNAAPADYNEGLNNFRLGGQTLADAQPGMILDQQGRLGLGTADPVTKIHVVSNDTSTATVTDVLRIHHSSSGVPDNNFGTGLLFTGESSSTDNRPMARIQSVWTDANDGSRNSSIQFQTEDNAAGSLTTHMSLESSGLEISADGGAILVPRKTTSGDPSIVNGKIYYNAYSDKFRVCENGTWVDMVGAGGSIFTDQLHVAQGTYTYSSTSFVDITDSDKVVTIPRAGKAVMVWSVGSWQSASGAVFQIRPVIGALVGPETQFCNNASGHQSYSSSWATPVAAGSVTVKLQYKRIAPYASVSTNSSDAVTWTLMVL